MNKEEFTKWLSEQSDDIQIFITNENEYNCVDIKIFTIQKDNDFLEWYLGM